MGLRSRDGEVVIVCTLSLLTGTAAPPSRPQPQLQRRGDFLFLYAHMTSGARAGRLAQRGCGQHNLTTVLVSKLTDAYTHKLTRTRTRVQARKPRWRQVYLHTHTQTLTMGKEKQHQQHKDRMRRHMEMRQSRRTRRHTNTHTHTHSTTRASHRNKKQRKKQGRVRWQQTGQPPPATTITHNSQADW